MFYLSQPSIQGAIYKGRAARRIIALNILKRGMTSAAYPHRQGRAASG